MSFWPMRFDLYTENAGGERWHLRADDGRVVATSVASFGTRAVAGRAAEDFRDQCETCDYDVWDNDGLWYWDANGANGNPVVTGEGAGFVSEDGATRAYEHVRDNAARASGP